MTGRMWLRSLMLSMVLMFVLPGISWMSSSQVGLMMPGMIGYRNGLNLFSGFPRASVLLPGFSRAAWIWFLALAMSAMGALLTFIPRHSRYGAAISWGANVLVIVLIVRAFLALGLHAMGYWPDYRPWSTNADGGLPVISHFVRHGPTWFGVTGTGVVLMAIYGYVAKPPPRFLTAVIVGLSGLLIYLAFNRELHGTYEFELGPWAMAMRTGLIIAAWSCVVGAIGLRLMDINQVLPPPDYHHVGRHILISFGLFSLLLWGCFKIPNTISIEMTVVIPSMVFLLFRISSDITRKERQKGLCPYCGYDLRESPNLCPECGRVTSLPNQP